MIKHISAQSLAKRMRKARKATGSPLVMISSGKTINELLAGRFFKDDAIYEIDERKNEIREAGK